MVLTNILTYSYIEDSRVKWDYFKYLIRKETIHFSKIRRSQIRDKKKEFLAKLDFLKDDLSESLGYDQVKNDLEQTELEEVEGIILRAGIRWRELGEKSTKYFLG